MHKKYSTISKKKCKNTFLNFPEFLNKIVYLINFFYLIFFKSYLNKNLISYWLNILKIVDSISDGTAVKNHTNVRNAARASRRMVICKSIYAFIPAKSHTVAISAVGSSPHRRNLNYM